MSIMLASLFRCFRLRGGEACFLGAVLVVVGFIGVSGCRAPARDTAPTTATAIRRVLDDDSRLGRVRNEATRNMTVADASLDYALALEAIDYGATPDRFRAAFLEHADAWRSFAEALRIYPGVDVFRTEMHDAIAQMKAADPAASAAIERELADVWRTWAIIERVAGEHGVAVE